MNFNNLLTLAARAIQYAPEFAMSPPLAIMACVEIITLSTRLMTAYTLASVIRLAAIPTSCRFLAYLCPEKNGDVSHTRTSNYLPF